jgi:hypothetical protein
MKAFKKEIYWQCDLMAMKKSNVACVHRRPISQYDSGERCGPWASCFAIFAAIGLKPSLLLCSKELSSSLRFGTIDLNIFARFTPLELSRT